MGRRSFTSRTARSPSTGRAPRRVTHTSPLTIRTKVPKVNSHCSVKENCSHQAGRCYYLVVVVAHYSGKKVRLRMFNCMRIVIEMDEVNSSSSSSIGKEQNVHLAL